MLTFGLIHGESGFDPLILMLVALMLDGYFGDAPLLYRYVKHPVVVVGDLIGLLDRKLNRETRSDANRAIRGALVVILVTGFAGIVGFGVAWLGQTHPWGWPFELLLVTSLLAGRSLYDHVRAVARGLAANLEQARDAVRHIVGRDPTQLDEHGVARAAIESAAENFCDGVVAPVFWYLLFGLPGLAVYKAVNTMDSMIGYRTARYRAFGMAAARLDDVLNIIPARLAGLFLVFAAVFVPKARPGAALTTMLRDAGKHRSMNAGWTEAAMAGALNLALAGPRRYAERTVNDPWIGDGSARATAGDVNRALYLYAVANLINLGWVAAFTVVRIGDMV